MRDWKTQCSIDIGRQFDQSVRAKHQAEAERWRTERRPRALRQLAAHATRLTWSRRLITLLLDELHSEDLFTQIVPSLDRLAARRYPQAVQVSLALGHSWRLDLLTRFARWLGIAADARPATLRQHHSHTALRRPAMNGLSRPGHHLTKCRARLRSVKGRRRAPTAECWPAALDGTVGRAQSRQLGDAPGFTHSRIARAGERKEAMRQLSITPHIVVTIGRDTRTYFAYVTTAPAALDSPATVTLHASTFPDVAGRVADPIGLKLTGFVIWEHRGGIGRNVTFPARTYSINGERSYALLRPIDDVNAQERVRALVLDAYGSHEERDGD